MTKTDYMRLFIPAVEQAADLLVTFEAKYGEGIVFSDNDAACCAGHAISSLRGLPNPDGKTHAVAALTRAIKVVLREQQDASETR